MNVIQSVKTCFKKYADFKGRATRSEYWWFQLFVIILSFVATSLDYLLLGYSIQSAVTPLVLIFTITIILPSAAVTTRRLHDIGWSGWIQLPCYVVYCPYLDVWFPGFSLSQLGNGLMIFGMLYWFFLYIVFIRDGKPLTNKYGPNLKSLEMEEVFN